jgi:hypothetical protein
MTLRTVSDKKMSDSLEALAGIISITCGFKPAFAFLRKIDVLKLDLSAIANQLKINNDNIVRDDDARKYVQRELYVQKQLKKVEEILGYSF